MSIDSIKIPVRLDAPTFRSFATFDTLKRQKRWRSPALFSGILTAFAIVCFAMNNRADQAVFIGSVLMIIAVGLPAVYFGMYFRSLDIQAKNMKLNASRLVYTLDLTDDGDGVKVTGAAGEQNSMKFHWKDMYGAYRVDGCIYLYISDRQAFLLPDGQANVTADDLWEYLTLHMVSDNMHDCRKN